MRAKPDRLDDPVSNSNHPDPLGAILRALAADPKAAASSRVWATKPLMGEGQEGPKGQGDEKPQT
jgi:hypothetical protein